MCAGGSALVAAGAATGAAVPLEAAGILASPAPAPRHLSKSGDGDAKHSSSSQAQQAGVTGGAAASCRVTFPLSQAFATSYT